MSVEKQLAHKLAGQLTTIPDCPRTDIAIESLAGDLAEICRENTEAIWLVHEARQRWRRWRGTAGLIKLLERHRGTDVLLSERQPFPDMGPKPKVDCNVCEDFGHVYRNKRYEYCTCAAGAKLRTTMPDFVEKLNRKGVRKLEPIPITRKRITEADLERAFRERQDRTEQMIAEARATLQNPEAPKDRKEMAREILRGFGVSEAG